jgi:hypothetical protein
MRSSDTKANLPGCCLIGESSEPDRLLRGDVLLGLSALGLLPGTTLRVGLRKCLEKAPG